MLVLLTINFVIFEGMVHQLHYFAGQKKIRTISPDHGITGSFAMFHGLIHLSRAMITKAKRLASSTMKRYVVLSVKFIQI